MIEFPKVCSTDELRRAYCYRVLEKLRLEHNEQMPRLGKDGKEWFDKEWEPRNKAVYAALNGVRDQVRDPRLSFMEHIDVCSQRLVEKRACASDKTYDSVITLSSLSGIGDRIDIADPTEDFTAYTENDASARATVTSSKVSWTGLLGSETAQVYSDKGANHFSGNFEHKLEMYVDSATENNGYTFPWWLSSYTGNYATEYGARHPYLGFLIYRISLSFLLEFSGATEYSDSTSLDSNLLYYVTAKRDESVGTYGTLYYYLYENSARSTLHDTLSITLHSNADFRYVFALNSGYSGTASHTGYVQNLDLQEIAPGNPWYYYAQQ